jgi:uncharacterized damage-inducible protein DinB
MVKKKATARARAKQSPSRVRKMAARKPTSRKAAVKKPAARKATGNSGRPTEKQQFLAVFTREHACTMKVLRAFPTEQAEFQAHPRSQTARDLAFTFVMEQKLISLAVQDQLRLGGGMPKPPEDFTAIVDLFDSEYHDLVALIERTPAEKLYNTKITFPVGPGQMGEFTKIAFAWFMLFDQIHHRGQYSVLLRLAGGKVPSIYGPSADEPWT